MLNNSEWKNLIGPALVLLAPVLTKYGLDVDQTTATLTGLVGIAYSLYNHWNQKTVPENATVVGEKK